MTPKELTALAVTTEILSPDNRSRLVQKSAIRVRLSVPRLSGDVSENGSRVKSVECNARARLVEGSTSSTGGDVGVGLGAGVGVAVGLGVGVGVGVGSSTLRSKSARTKL